MVDIAIVTGATGGIGSALCRKLSDDGFGVVALYGNNHQKAEELKRDINDHGGVCNAYSADLGSNVGIDAICELLDEHFDNNPSHCLRALVNNAARLLSPSFSDTQFEDFDSYFAVNTKAAFFLSQYAAKRVAGGGSIVNISSASAHFSSPGDIVYSMSKAALESLTRNMAEAVASKGIRVNAVIPGFTENGNEAFENPGIREYMSSFAIMGGVSQPETVANAVSFLISSASGRTTGALLDVTGGSLLGARGHRAGSVRELMK